MPEYQAKGRYLDSRGRSHTFTITTDSSDRNHIKEIVMSMYVARSVSVYNVRDLTYERVIKKSEDSFIPSFPSGPTFHTGDNEDMGVQYIRLFTRLLEITFFLLRISIFILKICWNVAFAISKFIYEVVSNEANQERVKRIIRSIYNFLRKTLFNLGNWDKLSKFLSKKVSWNTTRTNLFFKYFAAKLKSLFKKRSLNTLVEVSDNKIEETFKNKEANQYKNNPLIKNRFFPKSKKTINNLFIVFSVILSLVLGNEIRKSYQFYQADKKVPESKKSNSKIKIETRSLDEAKAYYISGWSKHKKGDYSGAISDYTKAIKLNPNHPYAYNNRGYAKNELKDYSGAISDYTKAIEINPKYAYAYYLNRGISKDNLENYSGAISDYTKAIEINPKDADAYYNRGISKDNLEYFKSACKDFKIAIRLGSDEKWFPSNCKI